MVTVWESVPPQEGWGAATAGLIRAVPTSISEPALTVAIIRTSLPISILLGVPPPMELRRS